MSTIIKQKLDATIQMVITAPYNILYLNNLMKTIKITQTFVSDFEYSDKLKETMIDAVLTSPDDKLNIKIINLLKIILIKCPEIYKLEELIRKTINIDHSLTSAIILPQNIPNLSSKIKEIILTTFMKKDYNIELMTQIILENNSKISNNLRDELLKFYISELSSDDNIKNKCASKIIIKYRYYLKNIDSTLTQKRIIKAITKCISTDRPFCMDVATVLRFLIPQYVKDSETSLNILRSIKECQLFDIETILVLYNNICDTEIIVGVLVEIKLVCFRYLNFIDALVRFVKTNQIIVSHYAMLSILKLLVDADGTDGSLEMCINQLLPILNQDNFRYYVDYLQSNEINNKHISLLDILIQHFVIDQDLIPVMYNIIKIRHIKLRTVDMLIPIMDKSFLENEFNNLLENTTRLNYNNCFKGDIALSIYKTFDKNRQLIIFHKLLNSIDENNSEISNFLVKNIISNNIFDSE